MNHCESLFNNDQFGLREKGLFAIFYINNKKSLTLAEIFRVSKEPLEQIKESLSILIGSGLIKKENNCFKVKEQQRKKREPLKNLISRDELEDMYNLKMLSTFEIATRLNHNPESVRRLMEKYGIKRRTDSKGSKEFFKRNDRNVNEEFFIKKTPDLQYIIGLLLTDGYIGKARTVQNPDGTIKKVGNDKIGIELTDKDVIEWLAQKIEYKNKIYERKRADHLKTTYTIQFANNNVLKVLNEYGMVECKSNILMVEDHLDRHMIRGIFEGDGSITKDSAGRYVVTFGSGSKNFIISLKDTIEKAIGGTTKLGCKKNAKGNVYYYFSICRQDNVKKFGEFIYKGNVFGMQRKKKMFQELGCDIGNKKEEE